MSTGAVLVDLAADWVTQFSTATLSLPFVATQVFTPIYDFANTPGLQIYVIGVKQLINLDSGFRALSEDSYTIQIGIVNTIGRDDTGVHVGSEMLAMAYFVQQVLDWIKSNRTMLGGEAQLSGNIENSPSFDPGALVQRDQYVSVISVTYRLLR